jgi:hypothetical protein
MRRSRVFFASLGLWLLLSGLRVRYELGELARGGAGKVAFGSRRDPRGRDLIDRLERQRESDSFRSRLARGLRSSSSWPGLKSAQLSWTWLEMLSSVANPASYEGDFSWIFSKLYDVAVNANPKETAYLSSLAPFYYVIGKDHAGADIIMEESLKRAPNSFNAWFWAGFHAMDNLYSRPMAAYLYGEAAKRPGAPAYVATLGARLKAGASTFEDNAQRTRFLREQTDPETLERIKKARPEWFEDAPN